MPMDLATFQRNAQPGVVDYGDGVTLKFIYRPQNVTEKTVRQLRALEHTDEEHLEQNTAAINAALCQLLISWDLTRHGVPVPLTPEALEDVPLDVRKDVLAAIFPEVVTDPTTASDAPPASLATSAPTPSTSSVKRASRPSQTNSRRSR